MVQARAAAADEGAAAGDGEEGVVIHGDVGGEAEAIAVAPHHLAGEHVERDEGRVGAGHDDEASGAPQAEDAAAPGREAPA